MTKDPSTPTSTPAKAPATEVPDSNPDEMSKARDFEDLGEKHGQDPEEVARRMGTTGEDLGHKR